MSNSQLKIINSALKNGGILAFSEASHAFQAFQKQKLIPKGQPFVTGNAVYKKIEQFLLDNNGSLQQKKLDKLDTSLAKRAIKLHSQTIRFRGFFLRLFAPDSWLRKVEEQKQIHKLRHSIQNPPPPKTKSSTTGQKTPIKKVPSQGTGKTPSNPPQKIPAATPPPNGSDTSTATPLSSFTIPAAPPPPGGFVIPAAPPPPGFNIPAAPPSPGAGNIPAAPPPPGAPGAPAAPAPIAQLSPEQKHVASEAKRLGNLLATRSKPEGFYYVVPPSNANELEALKKVHQESLFVLKGLQTKLPDDKILADAIKDKEAQIKSIDDQLSDTRPTPAFDNSGAGRLHPNFIAQIKKLTNEEIKFLLGQYFDGVPPKGSNSNYDNNKAVLDEIFANWGTLSNKPELKPFADQKEGWNEYIKKSSFFGFIKALQNRAIHPKCIDYIAEPDYTPVPFGTKPQPKVLNLTNSQNVDLDELKKKILARGANMKPKVDVSTEDSESDSDYDDDDQEDYFADFGN